MNFDTLFPDIRESGETPLRQCQLVMIRMFKIFDYLCRKYKIEYFLTGGTLLGAIRHQGFVPWDDDLDVGMTRENYEKFVQYAAPQLPNDIFFQTPETDMYFASCGKVEAKLRDRYSSYILNNKKYHVGLQVDIFVYDKAYLPYNACIFLLNRLLQILFWKLGKNNKGNDQRARVLKWISSYMPIPFVYSTSFISTKRMIKLPGDFIKKNEISKLIETEFEGINALIPQGWDACLKRQFSDYMKMPSVRKQSKKHSLAVPDAFKSCQHCASLAWEERKKIVNLQSEDDSKQI